MKITILMFLEIPKKNENSDEETIKQISNSFETLNTKFFVYFLEKKYFN